MRHRPPVEAVRAYATHAFTAVGAMLAMLAMLAAVDARWSTMFVWLVLAFVVDGIDGPMARRYDVIEHAPVIDGALLDLVIDYLTYVFVPVFALLRAGLLEGWAGSLAALTVVFASSLYFADTRMKTPDKSFSGFPAAWNMIALVVFAIRPDPRTVLVVVAVLTFAMFLPVRFVHPIRTGRWWQVSMPVAVVWTATAGWSAWVDFTQPEWVSVLLIVTSIYLGTVGAVQQVLGREGVGTS